MRHSSKHHLIPTSRGGHFNGWNKRHIPPKHHRAYHILFANLMPGEIITLIEKNWTNDYGKLKFEILGTQQITAWVRLFGRDSILNTQIAIENIKKEWDLNDEQKLEYRNYLQKRRCHLEKFIKRFKKIVAREKLMEQQNSFA